MTLDELGKMIGKQIEFSSPDIHGNLMLKFPCVEKKGDGVLTSLTGRGLTIIGAAQNYAAQLSGETIVVDAFQEDRREFELPTITAKA